MRRLFGVLAMVAMLVASAQPVGAATPTRGTPTPTRPDVKVAGRVDGAKSASGRLAQSDSGLVSRTDHAMVNVMIKYDVDAIASYTGDVDGFAATSPSTTGKALADNDKTVGSYRLYLQGQARTIRSRIQRQVTGVTLGKDFLVAFGGVAARLPANEAKQLLKVKGVAAVMYDAVNHPTALDSANFIGATAVWPSLGGNSKAGKGIKFADLDTGIWPENPMLADNAGLPAPSGGPFQCNFGTSGQPNDAPFVCNNKLIGAYAFVDTNLSVNGAPPPGYFCNAAGTACSARDGEGHGTHTATTAAGDKISSAILLGVDRGPISGIAPGAEVIMYRVCIQDSCYESDSVEAVQQAIMDDADVINFSIGGGADAYSDPVELAFLDAFASGIAVNASAGNSGPGAATAEHDSPWVTTVGASTLNRSFETTAHLTADGGATLDISGVTITEGISSPTPVILASDAPYSDALCNSAPSSGTEFSGKIVVCERGTNGRIDKGHNVYLGGGAGMILYNQSAGVTDLESDNHFLPAVQVQYQGNAVANFVSTHTNVMATWAPGTAVAAQGDVMASFSSRGPEPDFIKPDITAPGVQIVAGNTPFPASVDGGRPGENFQAIAGTSMSSPHASGASILLKAAHPSWTPGQIKSAMMTSSLQSVLKEDGVTPADPFDRGAGTLRVNRAVSATITFEATFPDFYAAANDPDARIDLNIPSIDAPNMPGKITTTRRARNVTGTAQTLHITTKAPHNSSITVTPSTLTIPAFGSATIEITIDGSKLEDGWYFGQITLDPVKAGEINAVLPVAFQKQPGDVSLTNNCDAPTTSTFTADQQTISKGETAPCEVTVVNNTSDEAAVRVKVKAPNTGRLIIKNWSDGEKKRNGFLWNGTLDAALPPPVLSMTPPGLGWFDLEPYVDPESSFGNDYGDETLINYNLTGVEVYYGDRVYDTVGVTSDGYLVMGGGEAADLNFVPQEMPDPNRPNNVLAPYWTDFDMSGDSAPTVGGGDVYIGYDGCFLIFEWKNVPIWGTDTTRSFQVTIGTKACMDANNGGDDLITFDYDSADNGAGEAGTPMNVGAEDALGLTAADLGVDSTGTVAPSNSGYYIDTGDSIPGGSKTITYDAYGKKTGNFDVKALMTSNVTQGTAVQIVKIHVVP